MSKSKRQEIISYTVFFVYFILLVWLVLFKMSVNIADLIGMRGLNLTPYAESAGIREIMYNVIVFIPFGVYMQIFIPNITFIRRILPPFILSVIFECVQFIFAIGASDITDIINNTLGGMIGVGFCFILNKLFGVKTNTIVNTVGIAVESCVIILFVILTIANS